MDVSLTPDTYSPSVGLDGNYIDNIPVIKNGIYCLCGTRKDKVYDSRVKFSAHIKTVRHGKWLEDLNNNKANFYVELEKSKALVKSQRKIIAELEIKLNTKIVTIDCLTTQIANNTCAGINTEIGDLIDI